MVAPPPKFNLNDQVKFEEVSPLQFYSYLENIRHRLKEEAPEWHINAISGPAKPFTLFYHLSQWDFTQQKKWPITMAEFVFAYEREDTHWLLTLYPIKGANANRYHPRIDL